MSALLGVLETLGKATLAAATVIALLCAGCLLTGLGVSLVDAAIEVVADLLAVGRARRARRHLSHPDRPARRRP